MAVHDDNYTSLEELFESGAHFGHQVRFWNPKMKQFIFGTKSKIHIINLDYTISALRNAVKFVKRVVRNSGDILFVGTRSHASPIIAEGAIQCGMCYVEHRWLGGTLTNFDTVRQSISKYEKKMQELTAAENDNTLLSKKDLLKLNHEVYKLKLRYGGIVNMKSLPAAIFMVGWHPIAILEAQKLAKRGIHIPIISIVDTNCDPTLVDYPIPGNDDAKLAIKLYVRVIVDAILDAKSEKEVVVNANDEESE
jgi:small subunit ribosomal protein S2